MNEILPTIDLSTFARPATAKAASVFRYPGGKGFLSGFLASQIDARFAGFTPTMAEPFCGGAGASLLLLREGKISRALLNDADIRIYSAWRAILEETDRFVEAIDNSSVNIKQWYDCVNRVSEAHTDYSFELGFSTFFINRTSRSGVILGSGPIGGYEQSGKWKIDARFNKSQLIKRVQALAALKSGIHLSNHDAIHFSKILKDHTDPSRTLLFVDPPYIKAGGRLYMDAMNPAKHIMLSDWLKSNEFPNWVLTYDDHPLVRESYKELTAHHLSVSYSLQTKRIEKELVYLSTT